MTYNRYPVILSIENHCSVEQQRKMAHYMITILGGQLLTLLANKCLFLIQFSNQC